ncbi:MAG: (2Fe-2S)-binding protein [Spirochaetaceae bacterium]|jgi:NAD(P)H-nitrite reductase large subunit|nr:(2Fe-2S)-binding protein [Spirochaetaceae bacterium]
MNWKDASDNEIVCYCKNIKKGTIVSAIKEGKASHTDIKESTTACTGGNCKEKNPSGKCCSGDILELINIYSSEKSGTGSTCCCCSK